MLVVLVGASAGFLHAPNDDGRTEVIDRLASASHTPRPFKINVRAPRPTATPQPVRTRSRPAPTRKPAVQAAAVERPATAERPSQAAPAPTRSPRPPRPPSTPAPNGAYSKEDVKAQIRAAWPGDDDVAVAVVQCETGGSFNPRTTGGGGRYLGLWQFDQETWERHGGTGDPRDASPSEQTRIAWRLYQARGWSAWGMCNPDRTPTPPPSDEPQA
jgi:hypothetical protein